MKSSVEQMAYGRWRCMITRKRGPPSLTFPRAGSKRHGLDENGPSIRTDGEKGKAPQPSCGSCIASHRIAVLSIAGSVLGCWGRQGRERERERLGYSIATLDCSSSLEVAWSWMVSCPSCDGGIWSCLGWSMFGKNVSSVAYAVCAAFTPLRWLRRKLLTGHLGS